MAEASSLEQQSPGMASCLAHGPGPGEPGLPSTAVAMGSAHAQFSLAEILSQSYGVREEPEEASRAPPKSEEEEELEKHLVSQSSDMPLDELLAFYGYEASDPLSDRDSEGGEAAAHLPDMTLDKIAKDLLSGEEETQSSADDLTPSVTTHQAHLFPGQSAHKEPGAFTSSDTEDDPLPANKCKKEIMVGPQFQADLSSLHLQRQGEKFYENEDQLLWDPGVLPEREVQEFLYRAVQRRWQEAAGRQLPEGEPVRDSEQALYELVKCNFNVEEALRRLRFNVKVIRDGCCAWSEEECRNFEHGFRVHGKNFHLIQANKVRTRSVGECVEYYYLWKKSERYDYFSQQTRLGRRKYGPSGTTDADQDLEGSDPEGTSRPRPCPRLAPEAAVLGSEQHSLAPMCTEPATEDTQPLDTPDGLPSTEPAPVQALEVPAEEPPPQQPPSPAPSAPHLPGSSPRPAEHLALPGALPEELALAATSGDQEVKATAPAQVALSVAEFGLIGIGDVNPFLAARHTEPLSHCNLMTC
ncbi:mesoderm induction early response protein 2 isoform X2 [Erinaceus europaeus]|uniref:Mesoderm induction early response protein 2 isoform X2 n=1 Tax=Erinaceus europaeus TaxID=9365 RepID=A0ABM3WLF3_ERIEU|nr:mesoderm induction early response protein 2 isoform X2 [Erinaceus europaeus]